MSKSRDIADSAATINYIDTVSSNVQDQINNNALPSQSGNAGKFLTTDGTDESWGDVSTNPSIDAVASGTLANGDTICLNSDGTVSAITGSSAIEGVGTLTTFNSGITSYLDSVYDKANDKLVIAYRGASPNYIYANVATISGSTITFGSQVAVSGSTGAVGVSLTYDENAEKVLFIYSQSAGLTGRVGTVSGTTLTFGTEATLHSGAIRTDTVTSGYDVTAQKHAVFYTPTSNTYLEARVATISGTSVSAGSATTLLSSVSYNAYYPKCVTYDDTAQKLVVFYMDYSDSEKGKANVCSISGTTISFGTQAEWSSGTASEFQAAYSPTLNKHMVVWRESTNSSYGTSRIATVSGTTITFGDLYVFRNVHSWNNAIAWDNTGGKFIIATRSNTYLGGDILSATVSGGVPTFSDVIQFSTTNALYNILTYDPDQGKVIGVYRDDDDSYGKSYVWTTGFFSSNLTSTNFLGFSDAAYTNGQTATVQIIGAQDDAQAGLTAGLGYYVKANGDLSVTPDSVSVYAGLATSASNIIVKG